MEVEDATTAAREESVAERSNGTGPRLQRNEPWLDLPPDVAPGFSMRVWLGFSDLTWQQASGMAESAAAKVAALRQVVREHNGWCDEEGKPYPAADSDEFWAAIPTRLGVVMLQVISQELYRLPLSLSATKRR